MNFKQFNSGSAQQSLNRNAVYPYEVTLPESKEDQSKIADVIFDITDKIRLNNQTNQTLEAMAQAIFKSWFVDFEPVKAKIAAIEAGEDTESITRVAMSAISGKTDEELDQLQAEQPEHYTQLKITAELFPAAMQDSELGKIPEGWEVEIILDFADLLSGGTPKTVVSEYWDGGVPWVSAKDVTSSNGTFILTTEKTITQKGIEKSSAKMLPKFTTVITSRGTVGNVCILSKEMAINQTNYGLKSKYDCGDFFLFFNVLNLIQYMKQNAHGTVFDTITTKTFRQIQITLPPMKFIKLFENIVGDLMHKVLTNLEESQSLSSIRDSLLPKLLSGELSVGTSELVEE